MKKKLTKYMWNVLIGFDQFINAILLGDPDETISSRLGKWSRLEKNKQGWRKYVSMIVCPVLNWIDPNHCEDAIEEDEGKNKLID